MLVRIRSGLVFLAGVIAASVWTAPASVQAQTPTQSISSASVTTAPSGQAVSVPQQVPRELTAEDLRLRDQALQRSNPPQVPVPVAPGGFVQRTPAVPPTAVPMSAPIARAAFNSDMPVSPNTDQPQPPNAPGTMTYFLAQNQAPFSGASKSVINEPSVGTSNDIVFVTSNWDAAYSTDRGASFTFLNPYTTFPASNSGFCCDQTAIYDRTNNVMIWQLQYSANASGNIYRIAFAAPTSIPNWCYYDFSPQQMGQPAGAWFDYPDIALTNSFLYVTARVFPASGGSIGTAIWRIPLAAAAQCQSITWNYNVFTDAFTFSLAQGATNTMYFFRHLSTSQERLFNWPDNSGTISWNDVNVTTWFDAARSCPGPDGLNWCARNNGSTIGRTSWVAGGVIGTMWSSSQGTDRPYPYVRVARFNESSKALINEPDIWTTTTAYIYPSVNINGRGHLGGVVFFGGGTLYPSLATLIWDDFTPNPPPGWEVYGVVASTNGDTTWGDYTSTRRHGASGNTWVSTAQFKASASAVRTQYVWFGRERDQQPFNDYFPNALTVSVGSFATGSSVNATKQESEPTHAGRVSATTSVWWRFTPSTSGSINLTTAGSNFDTVLAVYTGSSIGSLSSVASNDDCPSLGLGTLSCVTHKVVAGTTYRVAVAGFGAATGNIQLNLSTVRPPTSTHDFNSDGNSDILWRHSSGSIAMWLMNGTSVSQSVGAGGATTDWQIVGQRDFNFDGRHDILWRNTTSGAVAMWLMNGATVIQSSNVGSATTDWQIVGTGDFNGDGMGDILWRNATSGQVILWTMNGASITQSAVVGSATTDWQIAGVGDLNGDGRADILWRHSGGTVVAWLMSGATVTQAPTVGAATTDWQIVGTGDFNADARSDILWRHSSGVVAVWLMNGAAVTQSANIGSASTDWTISETADLNSNGTSDIIWRHSSGAVAAWLVSGVTVTQSVSIGGATTDWVVQGLNAN